MTGGGERGGNCGTPRRAMGRGVVVLLAVAPAACAGCSTKLLRENVLATTQSAIGLSLAQNAQTQMYELKAGFFRHEFFLVPTSKRVVNDADNKDAAGTTNRDGRLDTLKCIEHNDPSHTPEVLAEIQVGGYGKQSIKEQGGRVEVYQRLAVGRQAVRSRAAVALMASDAETAKVLSERSAGEAEARHRIAALVHITRALEDMALSDDRAKELRDRLNRASQSVPPPAVPLIVFNDDLDSEPAAIKTSEYRPSGESLTFADFADLANCASKIELSIATLHRAAKLERAVQMEGGGAEARSVSADEITGLLREQHRLQERLARLVNGMPEVRRVIEYVLGTRSAQ